MAGDSDGKSQIAREESVFRLALFPLRSKVEVRNSHEESGSFMDELAFQNIEARQGWIVSTKIDR
jgi:hypothetical protein